MDGALRFVSECTPDTGGELAIVSTQQGCNDPAAWEHDVARGVTHGMERFYYVRENRQREYVSGCLASSTTYRHGHVITGWRYNDADLSAWPVTEVSITVGRKKHVINTGMVLPGARKQPYVKLDTVEERTGQTVYEGCNAFQPTNRYERWRRPDGSVFQKPVGAGGRHGPRHACRSFHDKADAVTPEPGCPNLDDATVSKDVNGVASQQRIAASAFQMVRLYRVGRHGGEMRRFAGVVSYPAGFQRLCDRPAFSQRLAEAGRQSDRDQAMEQADRLTFKKPDPVGGPQPSSRAEHRLRIDLARCRWRDGFQRQEASSSALAPAGRDSVTAWSACRVDRRAAGRQQKPRRPDVTAGCLRREVPSGPVAPCDG